MSSPNTCVFAHPNYADPSVLYTPTFSGGNWTPSLPLTNLADRRLAWFARSVSAAVNDTIIIADLKTDRPVRVVALPKHSMSSAGQWRVVGYPSSVLFDYEVGDNLTAKGGTFSRASTATYVDANGVMQTASSGTVRDAHYINGVRHLLLEASSTNLCTRSEDFPNWTDDGASVSANAIAGPDGNATADLLTTTSGTNGNRNKTLASFTGNGSKSASVYLKAGSAPTTRLLIFDTTASAIRATVDVTWTAGVPTATANGGATNARVETVGSAGWYRISFRTASVTAANTHTFAVYPSAAVTAGQTVYAWGAQAEDSLVATSYIPTTSAAVTRSADSLYFTYTPVPQAMTAYLKMTEIGPSVGEFIEIGDGTAASETLTVEGLGTGAYTTYHGSGASSVSSQVSAGGANGDTIELRAMLNSDGSVQLGVSKNGGAETLSTASGARALTGSWKAQRLYFCPTAAQPIAAFRSVRLMSGVQSLATMQGIVYDSGWMTPWPGSLTAEDLAKPDGTSLNVVAFTQVPSTFSNARYWTIQLSDPTNSAGYLDVARLWISGAITPSVNMSDGDKQGYESDTIRSVTPGGAALYDVRASRRTDQFSIENLTGAESLALVRQMQRQLGLSGQFLWIPDPSDTTYGYERNFLAVLRELGALEARALRYNTTFGVVEEL